jgi:hypothetical protein
LKIFSPVSNVFPLTKQNSPQEGFKTSILKILLSPPFNTMRYQFENHKFLKIGGGAVLLLWAHTLSPFGMNRQKWNH